MTTPPDFSSMSSEEISAYIEKLLSEQAVSQNKIIQNLRKELTLTRQKSEQELSAHKQLIAAKDEEIDFINTDRKKLRLQNSNQQDLIKNILDNVKEHQLIYSKYLQEENIPSVDSADLHELNLYFEGLMVTLFNAVGALLKHQEKSLGLGTSERNTGLAGNTEDYSADKQAEEDGAEELDTAEETVAEAPDEKDFISQSEELELQAKTKTEGLTKEQLDKVILSQCSKNCSDSIAAELNNATAIVDNVLQECQHKEDAAPHENSPGFISVCDSNKVAGIIARAGQTTLRMHCPVCSAITTFKLLSKKKRINNVLTITDSLGSVGTVLSSVQLAVCHECGSSVEINPASLTDVALTITQKSALDGEESPYRAQIDPENNGKCASTGAADTDRKCGRDVLGTECIESKDHLCTDRTAAEQKKRKEQFNAIRNDPNGCRTELILSEQLLSTSPDSISVIDPALFDAHTFGMTPAFVKSRLSVTLLAACGTQFTQLGAPKNRTFNYFEGNGFPLSREHLSGAINAFARAYLHPVTELIRADIIKRSPALIMDESTLLVRESARRKQREGKSRKSQIWTLNSNWTSDIKASWFCVSESRSYQNVLDIIEDELKESNPELKYLITDGYTGYDAALKILQEQGIEIKSARCLAHARRPLHYLLRDYGLLRIYNEQLLPAGAKFTDFAENLRKYRKTKHNRKLTEREAQLLTIYWLINALFVLDSQVVKKHQYACNTQSFKDELQKIRQEKSALIIEALFDAVRLFIAQNPKIISCTVNSAGTVTYRQNKRYPESRALIYLLRFEQELKAFTKSADVELTSSAAERSLKLGICLRHACMFMHSEDGAHAFADFQTIINTCILNRVPVQHYLVWLVANMKWRMNKLRNEGHDDPTFFTMPGKKKQLGEDKPLAMYHKKNRIGYDKVDVSGLTPYDYRNYLLNRLL